MQLHLEGSEDLSLPRERVFQLLTDTTFLAKSLPDAQETRVVDENNLEAKMKIGVSFLTANMAVKMRLADKVPSEHASSSGGGRGERQQHEDHQRLRARGRRRDEDELDR